MTTTVDQSAATPGSGVRPGWPLGAPDEPPAGLGGWVPPLPVARPALSPRALTAFGIAAVLLLIGTAAITVAMIGTALAPPLPAADVRYLGSVRANSTLTEPLVDDGALLQAGHTVCDTIDARPTLPTVLAAMHELGEVNRWSGSDVAAVVGSAIGAYCPQHIPVLGG